MSFLGGAECSTAGNPLSQFTKHVQDDKSLQRDRLVGRGFGGMQEGMRSQAMGGQENMMDEFMQQPNQIPQGPATPFAMEQMRRELDRASHRTPSPGWAAEFDPGMESHASHSKFHPSQSSHFNPSEFQRFQHVQQNGTARTASPMKGHTMGYQQPMGSMMGMGSMGMGMGMGMGMNYSPYMQQQQHNMMQPGQEGKGKGKLVELDEKDWEAQFAQLESDQTALDDEANAAIERELNDVDRQIIDDESFEQHMGDVREWDNFDSNPLGTYGGFREAEPEQYLFEEENLFKTIHNPFEEGVKIMEEGGNLSLAALAFEAAVQKDPQHIEAWTKLGSAQAQNEKETPAIRALKEATRLDPGNLEALMGLAVSYTNEGYDTSAYRSLERWVATKYPSLITEPLSNGEDIGFTDRQVLHEKVTELFIKAAQLSPSGEQMDPDVQVGLGVLFYGAEEFSKAVDCFGAALASTESGTTNQSSQIHLLWNRMGATLANSGRSEEAIDAYERALALRPNFVRARYNLGVSCINIGCYEQAAQHLLGALDMHKVVEREGRDKVREVVGDISEPEVERMLEHNQSTNLFDTLRRVFIQMNRRDLSDKVGPGMNLDEFRSAVEF